MLSFKIITIPLLALASSSVANGLANCTKLNKITKFQTYDPYLDKKSDLNPPALGTAATIIDFYNFPRCELAITAIAKSGCKESPIKFPGELKYGKPHRGIQKLKACPYTDTTCTMGKGTCLEFMVEVKDSLKPNFILYDALEDYDGRIGWIYDGGSICLPKSGLVNMIALAGCYVSEVDFSLTGGGKFDEYTDDAYPFWLYGNDGGYGSGYLDFGDGFMLDTEYTVSAIYDYSYKPSQEVVRHFTFDEICP